MRISAAPRKPTSIVLRSLPVVAALMMFTPALALAQDTPAPEAPAADAGAATPAAAPAAGTEASYTKDQASRGKKAYNDSCAGCHGSTLGGSGEAPGLAGKGFREHWFVGSPEPFSALTASFSRAEAGELLSSKLKVRSL